jgi:hypothetical protein
VGIYTLTWGENAVNNNCLNLLFTPNKMRIVVLKYIDAINNFIHIIFKYNIYLITLTVLTKTTSF